jgi:hypothetical protein
MCAGSGTSHVSEIKSEVDNELRPIVRLRAVESRLIFPVWIDLGFDGDFVMHESEAARHGVRMTGAMISVTLGEGTERQMELGTLDVSLLRRKVRARVLLSHDTDPAQEESTGTPLGLIGLGLLGRSRVCVDLVPRGQVSIVRPIPRNG